ncbi:MAG: Metallo-dependent phosphatase-like protein [Monoraphidium minutum]|nr:MAG: Metallo-dependent phosphatase-like protein [Monoraphidium minutum]
MISGGLKGGGVTPSGNPLPAVLHRRVSAGEPGGLRAGGRCVFVGDPHGCIDELRALLIKTGFEAASDNLFVTGDLITKGPASQEVVELLRGLGAHCARGNNDDASLAALAAWRAGEAVPEKFDFVEDLEDDDVTFLGQLPFSITLPEYGVVMVHAGLVPDTPLWRQELWAVCSMRVLMRDPAGVWLPYEGDKTPTPIGALPWADCWPGPVHVIFGHDSKRLLQRAACATGLDTACATGGALTACVLPPLSALRESEVFRRKLAAREPMTLADLQGQVVSVPSAQPPEPTAAEPEVSEEEDEEMSGSGEGGGGSDAGNDYGMGSGSDGQEEGGSQEEEEEEEEEDGAAAGGGPGILGLASGSGEEDEDEGDVDDDLPSDRGDNDEGAAREPGSSDADDEGGSGGGSDGGDGGGGGARGRHASFLAGEKGASFAKAFSKIIAKPVKASSKAKAAAAAAEGGGGGARLILAESAGVQKRRQEEEGDAEARREAKKQRLAMKKRGHLGIPRKGADPSHDAREKSLQRLATRGVVLLFNAVNKAQRQKAEAEAAGGVAKRKAAAAKLGKASFLVELQQAATVGVPLGAVGGMAAAPAAARGAAAGGGAPGWGVLGEGFPGLTGGSKMKDWDKRASSDEDEAGEQPRLRDAEVSSDDGDGW